MTKTINMHDAAAQLAKLMEHSKGAKIVMARDGRSTMKLVPAGS